MNQHLGPAGIHVGFIIGIHRLEIDDPGSDNYRWLLLLDGSATCQDEHGILHRMRPGDCFIRAPRTPHRVERAQPGSYLEFCITLPVSYWRFLCEAGLIDEQQRFAHLPMGSALIARCWRCYERCQSDADVRARASLLQDLDSMLLSLLEAQADDIDEGVLDMVHMAKIRLDDLTDRSTVGQLAAEASVCEDHLRRAFRRVLGCNPKTYRIRRRIEGAIRLLRNPKRSLADIAAELGYADAFAFSKQFKQQTGIAPSRYREG